MAPQIVYTKPPEPKVRRRSLCYAGGDIVIAASKHPKDHFLLNSEILHEASPYFKLGAKEAWDKHSEKYTEPCTGIERKVITYYVVRKDDDGVMVLDTEPLPYSGGGIRRFYSSNNASGFVQRLSSETYFIDRHYASDFAYRAHKVMFQLLYGEAVDTESINFEIIAEATAYAEYYMLFEHIGPNLRALLREMPGLWADIRDDSAFHLALAIKLRCEEAYVDALRHFIGSGHRPSLLVSQMDMDATLALQIALKRQSFESTIAELTSDLQKATLATYIPHSDKEVPGIPVKTTYLASRFDRTTMDQLDDIARRIVSEWLTHQLCGTAHWSHVRQFKGGYDSGTYTPSSLRNACNLLVQTSQTGTELDLFDPNAAKEFLKDSSLPDDPYNVLDVEDHVKKHVRSMAAIALPYIVEPGFQPIEACYANEDPDTEDAQLHSGHHTARGGRGGFGRGRGRGGHPSSAPRAPPPRSHNLWRNQFRRKAMTAQDDSNCHYFICIDINFMAFRAWEEDFDICFEVKGLEPASEEWVEILGLVGEVPDDSW